MRSKNIFWRTVKLSSIIFFNLILLIYGICYAYKNIRLVGFGEYVQIIEISEDDIKIFDYKIKLPDYLS